MSKLIPKAIAYAKNVRLIENHSYQAWLKQQIEKEDLIAWAQRPDYRYLRDDLLEYYRTPWYKRVWGQLNGALP